MTGASLTSRSPLSLDARRAGRGALLGFGMVLTAGLVVFSALLLGISLTHGRTVMPGVQIAGVSIAGLDRHAATAKLRAALPSLAAGEITLLIDDESHAVSHAELGRDYALGPLLDRAFAVGRSGDPLRDAATRVRSLIHATNLPLAVHAYDPAAMQAAVERVVAAVAREPVDAVARRGAGGAFLAEPAVDGRRIDAAAVQHAIAAAAGSLDSASVTLTLSPVMIPPAISTAQAEQAAAQARALVADDLRLTFSADEHLISAGELAAWISFERAATGGYAPRVDEAVVHSVVSGLTDAVAREARNASFKVNADGGPTAVIAGIEGRELLIGESVSAVMAGLGQRAKGARLAAVPLAGGVTEPALGTAAAEAALPRMELISTWTTDYTSGPSNHHGANISIPARDIDGRVLAPGERFSFWGSIGPVTLERGYGMGGAIIGGRTVLDGAIAGGICATSTAIFNAAARAGLEMGDRAAHYYYIPRYPVGLDATVYKSDQWTQDMTFRNDTESPILVRGFAGDGWVRFDLWGVPTGRSVAFSDPVVTNQSTAVETIEVSNELAAGATRRVQEPYNGFDAVVNRTVRDANGDLIHADRWYSSYRTVNGIIEVGPTAVSP